MQFWRNKYFCAFSAWVFATGGTVAAYELLRHLGLLSPNLTPSFPSVLRALLELCGQVQFICDVAVSAGRALTGVLLGTVAGVPVGMLMGILIWVRRGLLPLLDFFRSLPAAALFPALTTLLGLGELMKVTAIALPCALLMATSVYYSCMEVRPELLEYSRLRGFSPSLTFRQIYFPSAVRKLPSGLHYTLPLALVLSVIADMFIGAQHGLGLRLVEFQETFLLGHLYATIVVTGLVGLGLSGATSWLVRLSRKYGTA